MRAVGLASSLLPPVGVTMDPKRFFLLKIAAQAGLLVLGALWCPPVQADPTPGTAVVMSVEGTVEAQVTPSATAWAPVKAGDRLAVGTTVRTGPNSRAHIETADGSTMLLDPQTTLQIDELDGGDAASNTSLRARLQILVGGFWADIVHLEKPADVEVRAGGSVIGVRGTNFNVQKQNEESVDVSCSDGAVAVKKQASPGRWEETMVPAGKVFNVRRVGGGLREMTAMERQHFTRAWQRIPRVRQRLAKAFRAPAARRFAPPSGSGPRARSIPPALRHPPEIHPHLPGFLQKKQPPKAKAKAKPTPHKR